MDFLPTWEIKQYTKKPRNACIRYQDYEERKEKKNQERTEDSSYWRNPYDCMGLKRLKLEIAMLKLSLMAMHSAATTMKCSWGASSTCGSGDRCKGWKFIFSLSLSLSHSLVILSLLSLYLWVFCWRLQWPTKYCHVHNSFFNQNCM